MPIPAEPPEPPAPSYRIHSSTGMKLLSIAVLTLALLIPVSFVHSVLRERKARSNQAKSEITASWGRSQTIVGPVLVIPYRYRYRVTQNLEINGRIRPREVEKTGVAQAYFLPSELEIGGELAPKKLHRGIFEAVVYSGRLEFKGTLPKPDFRALKIDEADVLWEDASVSFAIPDLRGTRGALEIAIGGKKYPMVPGCKIPGFSSGVHAILGENAKLGEESRFSMGVDLNGSESIYFAPLGIRTQVALRSQWSAPKFTGSFLPAQREVAEEGFSAAWDIPYYGRNYPQASTSRSQGVPNAAALMPSAFGVSFLAQVDSYRLVERSVKYAVLFIALVFAAFFLFEMLSSLKIHPFQYVLVGLALCLFFLILLSLSEFLPFGLAYLISAGAATAMNTLYSATFLNGGRRATLLAGEMAGVYGYLYVVLQLQDFSLLMGTALLTAILAAVMYATRRVDWYAVDAGLRQR